MSWSVVALAIALVTLGCLAIARSQDLADSSGSYLKRQLVWSVICIAAMLLASCPSYRILIRYSYVALAISIALLVAVYWFPMVNGSHRWIRFGPIGMQPSEFAKLAFVLGLSRYLMYRDSYRRLWGLVVPLALVMVPLVLVSARARSRHGAGVLAGAVRDAVCRRAHGEPPGMVALLAALVLTPLLWSQMSREQKSRITALAEQTRAGEAPTDDGYQLHQAKQLLALGGWGGSWLGGEVTKDRSGLLRARAAHRLDRRGARRAVWSVGPGRAACCCFCCWCGDVSGWRTATREPYGRLAAIGVAALLATQVTINPACSWACCRSPD